MTELLMEPLNGIEPNSELIPHITDSESSLEIDTDNDQKLELVCAKYEISTILYKALFNGNPKDRYFILRLENDLSSFISSATVSWRLQPLNSYYRLLVHQISAYYKMGHILLKDGASMVIFKENTSSVNDTGKDEVVPNVEDEEDAEEKDLVPVTKFDKMKLKDIPNELFPEIEVSNDISDDFLIKNGLFQSPTMPLNRGRNYNNRNNYQNGYNNYRKNQQRMGYQQQQQRPRYIYPFPGSLQPPNNQKPYKIISRKDSLMSSEPGSYETSPDSSIESPNTSISLENERLSKEEMYNKARLEIFEGEEEDGESEHETLNEGTDENNDHDENKFKNQRFNNKNHYQRRQYRFNNGGQEGFVPQLYPPYPPYGYMPPPPFVVPGPGSVEGEMNMIPQPQQMIPPGAPPYFFYGNMGGMPLPQGYYYLAVPQYNGFNNNNRRGYNKKRYNNRRQSSDNATEPLDLEE